MKFIVSMRINYSKWQTPFHFCSLISKESISKEEEDVDGEDAVEFIIDELFNYIVGVINYLHHFCSSNFYLHAVLCTLEIGRFDIFYLIGIGNVSLTLEF